jgi:hypothetical protein
VVFLERGVYFNKQVLLPGEAVNLSRQKTGNFPYRVHAVIGDEDAFPTKSESIRNLVKVTATPVAFVATCLATVYSGGAWSASMKAGAVMASRAEFVKELLPRKEKDQKLMCVTRRFLPGQRFLMVSGGLSKGDVKIEELSRRRMRKLKIVAMKRPMIEKNTEEEEERGDDDLLAAQAMQPSVY